MQQRCQWSAAKAGVTSVLRLCDATNAYLSMKHHVAKQVANEVALKEVDKLFFDLRISMAVVTISDEEGEINMLARSGMWPWDFCAPRIFVKATCSAFQPELEALEKKRRLHALRVEKCPITGQSLSLGTTGYVYDFACHLLGAGVDEPERRRPPAASCSHSTYPACGGAGTVRELKNPEGPSAKADRPEEAKADKLEEAWNEMQMEGGEDPWAGMGRHGLGRGRRSSFEHTRKCGEPTDSARGSN